jgi:hypothetical protein
VHVLKRAGFTSQVGAVAKEGGLGRQEGTSGEAGNNKTATLLAVRKHYYSDVVRKGKY